MEKSNLSPCEMINGFPRGAFGEIAKKANVSYRSVWNYAKGKTKSSSKIEKAIFQYYIEYVEPQIKILELQKRAA